VVERLRVRKNLVKPGGAASLDVGLANERALVEEARLGVTPWHAGPLGLVAEDHQHLLVAGVRDRGAIVNGAAFYDPVMDQGVLVTPDGNEVLVEIGTLHLKDTPGLSKLQRACLELAAGAYNDDRDLVSRWVVQRVLEAAEIGLRDGIDMPSWRGLLPRRPDAVWRALGDRWIMQPWGIGVDTSLGTLA